MAWRRRPHGLRPRGQPPGELVAVLGGAGGVAAFLRRVLAEYPAGPVDLVWDNLQAHKGPAVRQVAREDPRLSLHALPPSAPNLNPVEAVWGLAKHHRMANHAIDDLDALHATARRHLGDIGRDPALLRSCFEGAGLALSIPSA